MTEQRASANDTGLPANTNAPARKLDFSDLFEDRGKMNLEVAARRAAYIAEVMGAEPPARLLDEENCPAPELMDFANRTGANFDFIFVGDLRAMIMSDCAMRSGVCPWESGAK